MIVTYAYYTNTYCGHPIAENVFLRYNTRAQTAINGITRGAIAEGVTFSRLAPSVQSAVMNAICAQIEYYAYNGVSIANTGEQSKSFTVGKVSVNSGNNSASNRNNISTLISPQSKTILEQAGLLNRQVATSNGGFIWL